MQNMYADFCKDWGKRTRMIFYDIFFFFFVESVKRLQFNKMNVNLSDVCSCDSKFVYKTIFLC